MKFPSPFQALGMRDSRGGAGCVGVGTGAGVYLYGSTGGIMDDGKGLAGYLGFPSRLPVPAFAEGGDDLRCG